MPKHLQNMRLNQIAMDIVKGGHRKGEALRTVIVSCEKAAEVQQMYTQM